MNLWTPKSRLRLSLALFAAFLATVICVVQRHIHIVLSRPSTYKALIGHRCGLLFLGCTFLAFLETAVYTLATASNTPASSQSRPTDQIPTAA